MNKKYFGTDGIRGKVGESLINPEFVLKLGWAAGCVLSRHSSERPRILIGKDTRVSGYMLESALEAGLSAAGVDIRLLGPMPTPAIAYLTRTFRALAGIVISASHNPFYDNGIKFFSTEGQKLPDELELAIEEQLEKPLATVESSRLGKASRIVDAAGRYIEFCKSTIPSNIRLNGIKIVVDCANGATYHIAPNVLRELGAEVIAMSNRPDGFNINQECGSTAPLALQKAVLQEQADLGIALDGDGDRLLMIDNKGEMIDGDDILFIIAKDSLMRHQLCGGVVGTVMTNLGLEHAFREMNVEFIRTPVGDRYVLAELLQRGWLLGGEPSGHIVSLKNTTTGDGIIAALQVLAAMANAQKSLYDIKQGYVKYPQSTINIKLNEPKQIMQSLVLQEAITKMQTELNGKGRILVRPSGTESMIRIMVEGEHSHVTDDVAGTLANIIQQIDQQTQK